MKLRYTGPQPVTFLSHGVGQVKPGDEFEVWDSQADAFLSRADVEKAEEPVKAVRARKTSPKETTDGADTTSSED